MQRSVKKLHLVQQENKIQLNLPKTTQLYLLRVSMYACAYAYTFLSPYSRKTAIVKKVLKREKKRRHLGRHVYTNGR